MHDKPSLALRPHLCRDALTPTCPFTSIWILLLHKQEKCEKGLLLPAHSSKGCIQALKAGEVSTTHRLQDQLRRGVRHL